MESKTFVNQKSLDEHGLVGVGVKFQRIRRITGYLVGYIDRWNNAKMQELKDREKHSI
jgi:anaerobic ribonucleoside-triphosphate reductase